VSDGDILDVHQLEIVENRVLELLLLLGGVCVIESDEELAIAIGGSLGEVIVEESGLGVTDVKVTTCEESVKSRDACVGEEHTWAREGNG
jgi:hypothetical protein